jgi:hypothetical protein
MLIIMGVLALQVPSGIPWMAAGEWLLRNG